MKFTNGYWRIQKGMDMRYAVEAYQFDKGLDYLRVVAVCRPVRGRGDLLNLPTLTVTFTSPQPDTIRVRIVHFAGQKVHAPKLSITESPASPVISETEDAVCFTSGHLTARVHKGAWQVDYLADGELLTQSGYHGMASALNERTGLSYMLENLMLDVGENVYGLGEHFGPYVKNGQSIDFWNEDGGTASEQGYKNVPF